MDDFEEVPEIKSYDPYLYYIRHETIIETKHSNKPQKQVRIVKCYASSGRRGGSIRNAVSGLYSLTDRQGSTKENLYFSVVVATGIGRQDRPVILFYESPEQYERHFGIVLTSKTKKAWYEKYLIEKQRCKWEEEDHELINNVEGVPGLQGIEVK